MSLSKYKIPGLDKEVDIIFYKKEFYFRGREIAKTLGYKDLKKALQRLDDEDKILLEVLLKTEDGEYIPHPLSRVIPGGLQPYEKFITEEGFYVLTFQSKLPDAKPFRKGVCKLLKTIRKKGLTIEECIETLDLLEDKVDTEPSSIPDFVFSQQEELEDLDTLRNFVIEEYLETKNIKNNDTVSKLKFYKEHKKRLKKIVKEQNLLPEDDI